MDSGARAQSEVLGTALLLGITVISIALVVSIAGSALDTTRDTADVESAEHAMSQLDSKAALVALGRTESQTIDMGRARSGSYHVNESAGWLRITHLNYTPGGADEVIYENTRPLGAIVYEHGDQTVAYQGGGVWRSDGTGSVLVSPPEFHYRGETLTIPIIQVRSPTDQTRASNSVRINLRNSTTRPVFPNASAVYGNDDPFINPIQNGSIRVSVHSEYYRAWGSFFRSRTEGQVRVYDSNKTAMVELVVPAVEGEFKMPLDGDSIKVSSTGSGNSHAVTDLNLTLAPDDSDSAQFSNLKWSLYAEDGSEQLELHIRGQGNPGCGDHVKGTVYYTNGSGTYQGWSRPDAFPVKCQDWNGDGDDEARVVANWSSTKTFEYGAISNNDLLYFNPQGSLAESVTYSEHAEDSGTTFTPGSTFSVNHTVSHYATFLGPTVEFTVADAGGGGGASGSVNEDVSSGRVHYGNVEGSFVTYIHATENTVNVTVS